MPFALGDWASVGHLQADTIDVGTLTEGTHLGSHLKIGDTSTKNTASINQTDSLLHVNYAFYLNVVGASVQENSSLLTLTTTTPHNLVQGDVVEVEHASTLLADYDWGDIDGERLVGTGTSGTTLKLILPRMSLFNDTNNAFTCGVHGTHYKYIDLADTASTTAWTRAGSLPAPLHKNVSVPATWAPY